MSHLLGRLHGEGCQRDRAGNVQNHHYITSAPSAPIGNTSYTFEGDLMMQAGSLNLDWNENGNLTAKDDTADTNLVYNWDNKLRSGTKGSDSINIKYDLMGNRVYKSSSVQGTRKYIVDLSGELPTILLELDPHNGKKWEQYSCPHYSPKPGVCFYSCVDYRRR